MNPPTRSKHRGAGDPRPFDYVPLSVRTGGRRKRLSWWWGSQRERLAYRLAPWLRHGR